MSSRAIAGSSQGGTCGPIFSRPSTDNYLSVAMGCTRIRGSRRLTYNGNGLSMTSTPLCMAYYQGAYGPTIRVDAQKKEHLLLLRGIFIRLVNNQAEEVKIDVAHFPGIQFLGLDNLVLKVCPDSHNSPHGPETHHPITLLKKRFFYEARKSENSNRCT